MPRRRIIIKKEKDKLVVGQIMGGLGNQLFIIFTTIAYSLEHNMNYSIINIEKKRKSYFDNDLYKKLPLFPEIFDKDLYKNLKVNDKNLKGFKTYNEPCFHYKEIPKEDTLILFGYFQSYKYFDKYKDTIIRDLDILNLRKKFNYDGFLHFRLGDYKNIECHPVCTIDYYIESLRDIEENNKNILKFVYYFEEENRKEVEEKVDILREKFKRFSFYPIDTNMVDYQQMLSMTTLKYCIIANSSFSWWGAYLNDNPNKKVYYPKKWFEGSLSNNNTSDMIPRNWDKKKLVLATGFYILKNKFNLETYIGWMKNLLSYVNDFKLVIFCDENSLDIIKKLVNNNDNVLIENAGSSDRRDNIKIIIKNFEDFYLYKYKDYFIKNHPR